MLSPESVFPRSESPVGLSGSTRAQNPEPLDPKGVLQAAAQWTASVTGAHGAAIAIGDAAGMRCCASFGNAPVITAPVSITSGLSGICLRTSKLVQCDDTETDPRADAVACRQLDLRSVLIVPVLVDGSLRALIEVFSSKPHAFDARHRQDLARMADSLAALLADRDSKPAASVSSSPAEETTPLAQVEAAANHADIGTSHYLGSFASAKATQVPKASAPAVAAEPRIAPIAAQVRTGAKAMAASGQSVALSSVTWRSFSPASKAGIIAVSLVFLLAVVWYLVGRDHTSAPMAMNAGTSTSQEKPAQAAAGPEITFDQSALSVTAPLDGSPAQGTGQSSQLTPGKLIRRVDPTYPPLTRDAGIGGSVVLTAIVSRTGAVENVKAVRGPEPLAEAAAEAVRQWVYEPYRRNGEPVAVQTTIIVRFTPPKRP
jgi:TonB family protein